MSSVIPPRVDVLILASHAPDLRGMRTHLGERLYGEIGGLHVAAKTVGLGLAVAGASAAKRVFQLGPRGVIHLGTCGAYPGAGEFRPHDVLVANRIRLFDQSLLSGKGTFPDPMSTEIETDSMLTTGITSTGGRTSMIAIASTLATTTDDTLAAEIATRTGCQVENHEAFAIANACNLAQVPFTSIIGLSHVVGSRAQEDWQQFSRQATISAAEVLVTWLKNGARGLPHG